MQRSVQLDAFHTWLVSVWLIVAFLFPRLYPNYLDKKNRTKKCSKIVEYLKEGYLIRIIDCRTQNVAVVSEEFFFKYRCCDSLTFHKGPRTIHIETWIDRFRKSPWLLSFEMWETLWQIFEAFRHFYSCLCFALLYWNLKILCIVSENMFLVFELFTERSGWEQLWCIQFTLLPVSYFAFYFGNYDTYFLKFCKIKDIFSKFPKFGVYDMIWRHDVFS